MINSLHNDRIKNIVKLAKNWERKKQELIIVEGEREIELALKKDFSISEFYYCPELANKKNDFIQQKLTPIELAANIFKKITFKENPDGYLALVQPRYQKLIDIKLSSDPLIIILENVEKPGNLGAICRTAYAGKIDAIIINDPQTDIYNPNVIRASMGHIFTNQIVITDIAETKKWLKANKIKIYGATTRATKYYHQCDLKVPSAIVMGTEANGLSAEWLKNLDQEISIPMQKNIDSLNVSVSTAIIIYEALRQRDFVDFY